MAIETKTGNTNISSNIPSPAVNANSEILAKALEAAQADKAGTVDNSVNVTASQLEQLGQNNSNSGITRPGVGSAGVSQNTGIAKLTPTETSSNIAAASEDQKVALDSAISNLTIADLRAGALNHNDLQGLFALLGVKNTEPAAPKRRWEEFKRVYQFPSAPTSFHFSFAQGKVNIPEGIYGTNDADEIKELDAAVRVGNIWEYSPEINYNELAPTTRIPQPVRTDALN